MSDWMEAMALSHEGFTDAEVAQIDAAKDDLNHVVATIEAIWPRLTRLIPVATMIAARIAQHQKETSP